MPFICFWLQHKAHSIQKPIEELKHPCAQTPKVKPVTLNQISYYRVLITNLPVLSLIQNTIEIYMQKHVFFLLYFKYLSSWSTKTRLFSGFSFHPNTKSWAPFDSPVIKDFDKKLHVHKLTYAEVMVTCLKHGVIFSKTSKT